MVVCNHFTSARKHDRNCRCSAKQFPKCSHLVSNHDLNCNSCARSGTIYPRGTGKSSFSWNLPFDFTGRLTNDQGTHCERSRPTISNRLQQWPVSFEKSDTVWSPDNNAADVNYPLRDGEREMPRNDLNSKRSEQSERYARYVGWIGSISGGGRMIASSVVVSLWFSPAKKKYYGSSRP